MSFLTWSINACVFHLLIEVNFHFAHLILEGEELIPASYTETADSLSLSPSFRALAEELDNPHMTSAAELSRIEQELDQLPGMFLSQTWYSCLSVQMRLKIWLRRSRFALL